MIEHYNLVMPNFQSLSQSSIIIFSLLIIKLSKLQKTFFAKFITRFLSLYSMLVHISAVAALKKIRRIRDQKQDNDCCANKFRLQTIAGIFYVGYGWMCISGLKYWKEVCCIFKVSYYFRHFWTFDVWNNKYLRRCCGMMQTRRGLSFVKTCRN